MHHHITKRLYWLVPRSVVNNYCVLCTVKAKKENNIQQRILLRFIIIPSINYALSNKNQTFFLQEESETSMVKLKRSLAKNILKILALLSSLR